MAAIAVVTLATTLLRTELGLPAIALLFLLPVLATSSRGGLGPGLFAAAGSALAYNFFLLPPRFTLQVHGYDNIVAFLVLLAVAVVTTRLASGLADREAAAQDRAAVSGEAAALAADLAAAADLDIASARALSFVGERFGVARLIPEGPAPADLGSLDAAAAAWAAHNGDVTGHGSEVMPAADWSFIPLRPGGSGAVLAVARPADGATRSAGEIERLESAARLIGQALDRLQLDCERADRAAAEQRADLLRSLLASLAHDLRTPLTLVRGGLAEVRATGDAERLDAAVDAADRLERTLSDLMDAARIEAGAVGTSLEPVDLVDVVQAALAEYGAGPEGIGMEVAISDALPLVSADPVLLRQILVNLTENAARHAATRVTISARARGRTVWLAVHDDGAGVTPGDETRIFERFFRSGGDDRGGSGLGLAIVKGFADAMHMPIEVRNAADGGATFTLELVSV
ncbi:DUF4118 domain-containing protein [Sphingomonas sp. Root241]|uniref:DUF4118 domain-containing protein n=1 Tax=Sphingomonas sp. Root241 TaxID=1736501 RepID=UPI002AA2A9AF|nr:DUF4118 domain-containing protein [Sphingomonas sp. Root241]